MNTVKFTLLWPKNVSSDTLALSSNYQKRKVQSNGWHSCFVVVAFLFRTRTGHGFKSRSEYQLPWLRCFVVGHNRNLPCPLEFIIDHTSNNQSNIVLNKCRVLNVVQYTTSERNKPPNEYQWNNCHTKLRTRGSLVLLLLNTLRTGLLNCLNARSRGLNFRHRASCI